MKSSFALLLFLFAGLAAFSVYLYMKAKQTAADAAAASLQRQNQTVPLGGGFGYITVPGGTTGSAVAAGIQTLPTLITTFSNLFSSTPTSAGSYDNSMN
jgi:hypothetical protein